MTEFLTFVVDKFTFKVATDRLYDSAGVWVREEGGQLRVGVSDYFQQHNGDVAFVWVAEAGRALRAGDLFATIETIKVNIDLNTPVDGEVIAVNEALEMEAERINQDPYGDGWLALLAPLNWAVQAESLLSPEDYLEVSRRQAVEEMG